MSIDLQETMVKMAQDSTLLKCAAILVVLTTAYFYCKYLQSQARYYSGLSEAQPKKQELPNTKLPPSPQPPSAAPISGRCRCGARLDFPAKPSEEETYWHMICPNPECGRRVKLNCEKARRL